jgi:hypothetical protein
MGLMGEKLKQNNAKYCISDWLYQKRTPLNKPAIIKLVQITPLAYSSSAFKSIRLIWQNPL